MGIDQAGQNDFVRDIHDLPGAGRQNVGLNGGDLAVANSDILDAIDARSRIDDAASAQKQIKCGAHRHGRSPFPIAGVPLELPANYEACFVFSSYSHIVFSCSNIRAIDCIKFMQHGQGQSD
jgi:hypothetical protein